MKWISSLGYFKASDHLKLHETSILARSFMEKPKDKALPDKRPTVFLDGLGLIASEKALRGLAHS